MVTAQRAAGAAGAAPAQDKREREVGEETPSLGGMLVLLPCRHESDFWQCSVSTQWEACGLSLTMVSLAAGGCFTGDHFWRVIAWISAVPPALLLLWLRYR